MHTVLKKKKAELCIIQDFSKKQPLLKIYEYCVNQIFYFPSDKIHLLTSLLKMLLVYKPIPCSVAAILQKGHWPACSSRLLGFWQRQACVWPDCAKSYFWANQAIQPNDCFLITVISTSIIYQMNDKSVSPQIKKLV